MYLVLKSAHNACCNAQLGNIIVCFEGEVLVLVSTVHCEVADSKVIRKARGRSSKNHLRNWFHVTTFCNNCVIDVVIITFSFRPSFHFYSVNRL